MKITYDPVKRDKTLLVRNLDFARAGEVFARHHFTWADQRRDYGEQRFVTFGKLDNRMIVMVWTRREDTLRIISLRKANEREQIKYGSRVG
ncbi:MAG: BrnT family toxin [Magnetococcales bacterium]|nr:BrnT family toxin [Magnetococcales bacterium]